MRKYDYIGPTIRNQLRMSKLYILTLLSLCALLFITPSLSFSTQAPAQSSTSWLQDKMNKPGTGDVLRKLRNEIDDSCDLLKQPFRPSPLEPIPCWTKQIEALKLLNSEARKDSRTPRAIRSAIQNDLKELQMMKQRWEALPKLERKGKLKMLSIVRDSIQRAGGDINKGLQQLISDPNQTKNIREAAQKAINQTGCMFGCFCNHSEGCPCCDSIIIYRMILEK